MTSQGSRTTYDGREQHRAPITRPLRAPITRPLYHTAHASTHRPHISRPLVSTVQSHHDSIPLPIESYTDERRELQPPLDRISALCEEIAATMNESDAIGLATTRVAELMSGASVEVLVDVTARQSNAQESASQPSLRMYDRAGIVIDVPLMSGGALLGVLRIVPSATPASQAYDPHVLGLVGAALGQALDRHRLHAALDRRDAASLRQEQERWETFLERVAHEVKTPLAGIKGHAQLVRRYVRAARDVTTGELTPESAAGVVDACERHLPPLERQVAHIERLMRDMLDLAQIEQGILPLTLERCDFVALLRQALHDVDAFEDCRLVLTVPDTAWLTCDARRIEQALYDVLHYAIRLGGFGATLNVSVSKRQLSYVPHVLAIIGNRPHSPQADEPAKLSRHQLHILRDHPVAGVDQVPAPLALGLALSATISRVHGGNLYHLPHASTGDTFVLALPVHGQRAS